jgi:hypothetical protein
VRHWGEAGVLPIGRRPEGIPMTNQRTIAPEEVEMADSPGVAGSELIIVDDEGHGGESMAMHWCRVLPDLA